MKPVEWVPRISLGDMITVLAMVAAVVLYGSEIQADVRVQSGRIDAVKAEQERLKHDQGEAEARTTLALQRIEAGMNRIEDKIDRKVDK